jgi:hypothetical protein
MYFGGEWKMRILEIVAAAAPTVARSVRLWIYQLGGLGLIPLGLLDNSLIPLPVGDFRKAWQTACVAASVGKFVCWHCGKPAKGRKCEVCGTGQVKYIGRIFHDFRRTSVRSMVRAGVNSRITQNRRRADT